ncbi:kinase-like domain-containing protein [Cerioporus squamosus]|nr:kinase-like domain-containing protein [Cerioporus squamosus]
MNQPRTDPAKRGLLSERETYWRDRHDWLKERGFELRPRFRPGWTPSWKGTNRTIISCEDGMRLMHTQVIDAVRTKDGEMVAIKQVDKSDHPQEVEIGRYFTKPPLSDEFRNHCIPYFEVLQDPQIANIELVVMPLLREYNDPPFVTVGEAVEFFHQAFEGLQFMHEHHVAHRDIMTLNIMMDSKPILPDMFHPTATQKTRDFKGYVQPYTRTARPVRYYLTDFGLSRRYSPDDPNPLEVPIFGGDKSVPEFQKDPYAPANPFRTDVYYMGNLIREDFLQVYKNLTFMLPLVARMVQDEPEKRPTMDVVVSEFKTLASKLGSFQLRSRLVERRDGALTNFFKTVHHTSFRTIPHVLTRRPARPTPKSSTSLAAVAAKVSQPARDARAAEPTPSTVTASPPAVAVSTPPVVEAPSHRPDEAAPHPPP